MCKIVFAHFLKLAKKGGIGQEALAKMGSLFSSEARKIVILISQELATGILDGTAHAFKRCGHLSPGK